MSAILTSILRMVGDAFPATLYGYPRTYKVSAVRADKRLDLVPPPDKPHLPELAAVEQWGLGVVTPAVGTEVCVQFRDADPTRPIVVPWGFGSTPDVVAIDASDKIDLGAPATRGVARLDDTVIVLLPPAMLTGTVVVMGTPSPISGMVTWASGQTTGTITTASSKVEAE